MWDDLLDSTIWEMSDSAVRVWATLMLLADENGDVWCTEEALARRARVRGDRVRKALDAFLAPDPKSKNQDHEGRRLIPLSRGWHLVSYVERRARNPKRVNVSAASKKAAAASGDVPAVSKAVSAGGPSDRKDSKDVPIDKDRQEVEVETKTKVVGGVEGVGSDVP